MEDETSRLIEELDSRIDRVRSATMPLRDLDGLADQIAVQALDFHRANTRPVRTPSVVFLRRANAFLAAIETQLALQDTLDVRRDAASAAMINHDIELIAMGTVRTTARLRYLEDAFFTYWNETAPSLTRTFWQEIESQSLPYRRRDLLAEIFERGRIRSRLHYEHAVDSMGGAQIGLLAAEDEQRLAVMIARYERGGGRS